MKGLRLIVSIILTICMTTIPCSAALPETEIDSGFPVNCGNLSEEVIYHFDAQTYEITLENIDDEVAEAAINSTVTEGNTYECIPENSSSELPSDISPFLLLGNWSRITSTTSSRYRNTARLRMTLASGATSWATGFFIGPSTIVTAGHVAHNTNRTGNPFPTSMTVFPAYSNSTAGSTPYGSANATSYIMSSNWVDNRSNDYDWAIVRLNSNLGDSVGHYGLRWQSASYNGTDINAHGYPGTVNGVANQFLYLTTGKISASFDKTLRSINTNIDRGMSGGPLYIYSSTYGYQAIGIISGAISSSNGTSYNRFTRIDQTLYNRMMEYADLRV